MYKNINSDEGTDEEKMIYKEGKHKKIAEFVNGDFKKLDKSLIKLQIFVGSQEPISNDAMDDLIEYLQDEFEEFSIIEIESAVKMAISGSMEVERIENIRYFSAIYLSKILAQYRLERSRVILKYQKGEDIIAQELKDAHNKANAEKNNKQIMQDLCKSAFDNYKAGKNVMGFNIIGVNPIYKFLTEKGTIKHTEKEMHTFSKKADELLKLKALTNTNLLATIKNKETIAKTEYKNLHDLELKTIIITNYFQGLINTKKDIVDIFEKPVIPQKIPLVITKTQTTKNPKKN